MRNRISLDGEWDFVADLDPGHHAVHGGYHAPAADRRHWLRAPVPGAWQKYGQRYDLFEGVCWFAREFDAPALAQGAVARLRFGAVNYLCRVFLNGAEVGGHEGGYTEFELDCTAMLKPGRNHIAVQVDNRATGIKWPACIGYFNYGGIHRAVTLDIAAGPVLEDVRVEAVPDAGGGVLTVAGRVSGMRPGIIVRVVGGRGRGRESSAAPDGAFSCRLAFPGAAAWTPAAPHLEPVAVELLDEARAVIDRLEFKCGFRSLAARGGRLFLNGEPLALKGICYVYDSPVTGLVMTPAQIEADLLLMKEMGCNAVRCHYPMDGVFYSACDRLGMMVWIEPPIYCYHPGDHETGTRFADPACIGLALQMAREMVASARNHPCVAIYGIGNECNTNNPEAGPFFRQLASAIRAADSTRLVAYAALYGIVGPIIDIVDVLGINSYWGWYDKIDAARRPDSEDEILRREGKAGLEPIDLSKMREMLAPLLDSGQDRPPEAGETPWNALEPGLFGRRPDLAVLLTEFGADSVPGFFSRSRDLWSEDYHADLLRAILALAGDYSRIAGTFPFCFSDYRDPSKLLNGYWNELNLKGAVSYERRPKLAFAALKQAYSGTPPNPG